MKPPVASYLSTVRSRNGEHSTPDTLPKETPSQVTVGPLEDEVPSMSDETPPALDLSRRANVPGADHATAGFQWSSMAVLNAHRGNTRRKPAHSTRATRTTNGRGSSQAATEWTLRSFNESIISLRLKSLLFR